MRVSNAEGQSLVQRKLKNEGKRGVCDEIMKRYV